MASLLGQDFYRALHAVQARRVSFWVGGNIDNSCNCIASLLSIACRPPTAHTGVIIECWTANAAVKASSIAMVLLLGMTATVTIGQVATGREFNAAVPHCLIRCARSCGDSRGRDALCDRRYEKSQLQVTSGNHFVSGHAEGFPIVSLHVAHIYAVCSVVEAAEAQHSYFVSQDSRLPPFLPSTVFSLADTTFLRQPCAFGTLLAWAHDGPQVIHVIVIKHAHSVLPGVIGQARSRKS